MGKGFKHGGGGSNPLNLHVVGGTTQPSTPKENTIWVNTSTAITGWVISPVQPSGTEGMVWIQTGETSNASFNALKKNSLMICPVAVKQYASSSWGGSWQDRTGKIYTGGKWADWVKYQYISLDANTWDSHSAAGQGGSIAFSGGSMKVTKNGSGSSSDITRVVAYTKNSMINMSGYNTLEVEMALSRTDCQSVTIGVGSSIGQWSASKVIQQTSAKTVYSVDISRVSSGGVVIEMAGNNNATTATISAVRLKG